MNSNAYYRGYYDATGRSFGRKLNDCKSLGEFSINSYRDVSYHDNRGIGLVDKNH